MSALPLSVSFCQPMVQKETAQLGTRIRKSVKQRALDFCVAHPMQPALATVIENAITEYLDREETKLPQMPKNAKLYPVMPAPFRPAPAGRAARRGSTSGGAR